MMARTALVTGACGFVGTHMVSHLIQQGWDVIATDLDREDHGNYYCENGVLHPSYQKDAIGEYDMEFIPADLTRKETLYPLFEHRIDVIFNIASLYDYFALWDVLYKINVEGTRNLVEVAVEKGVRRIIHWSTEGVYGETPGEPVDEDFPKNPTNLYSKSKLAQENLLWDLHEGKKIDLTILRPGPIYGPRHRYGVFHILYGVARLGVMIVPVIYPVSRTLMFPSVEVRDLVRAALFVAERDESCGEAYNLLSDPISQAELMELVCRQIGIDHIIKLPMPWPIYKALAAVLRKLVLAMDRNARKKNKRPKVDVPMIEYMTNQYWFSNEKIKNLGFKFIYQDPRKGLYEFIGYCKERGLL